MNFLVTENACMQLLRRRKKISLEFMKIRPDTRTAYTTSVFWIIRKAGRSKVPDNIAIRYTTVEHCMLSPPVWPPDSPRVPRGWICSSSHRFCSTEKIRSNIVIINSGERIRKWTVGRGDKGLEWIEDAQVNVHTLSAGRPSLVQPGRSTCTLARIPNTGNCH